MLGPAFARLLFAAAVAFPKAADDPDPTKWKPENCSEHLVHEPIHSSHSLRGNWSAAASAMGKGPSSRAGWRHRRFRARAKTRVDDLQEMFSGFQSAHKDSRSADAAVLEEQLHQMLHEWRAELSAPSPASSLQVLASFASFRAHFSFLFPRRGWWIEWLRLATG
jgi:hypothetical protein